MKKEIKRNILRYRKIVHGYGLYIILFITILIFSPIILWIYCGWYISILINLILIFFNILIILYLTFIRNDKDKICWLLFILLLPFVGTFLFIFFTCIQFNRKIFKQKKIIDRKFLDDIHKERLDNELLLLQNRYSFSKITTNNKQKILYGKDVYNDILKEILEAKKHIHIEMYIIRYDNVTKKIFDALILKSNQKVKIKILIDVFGSVCFSDKNIQNLIRNKIEVIFFNQNKSTFFDALYVNHRKNIIIDGLVAYTGGFNLGSEYINGYPKKKLKWFDLMVKIKGKMVDDIQANFILDWNFSRNNKVKYIYKNYSKYFNPINRNLTHKDNNICQYITDGADRGFNIAKKVLLDMIVSCKRRILISTPYFIPSHDLIDALKKSIDKGVDVTLIIPGVPDKKIVYLCTRAHLKEILNKGAKVYKCDDYFVHSKLFIFDDKVIYGTVNFDMRSFYLNFEELIISYNDKKLLKESEFIFNKLINMSTIIDNKYWKKRKVIIRFIELISTILKPIF